MAWKLQYSNPSWCEDTARTAQCKTVIPIAPARSFATVAFFAR